jgi:hypothetical protein
MQTDISKTVDREISRFSKFCERSGNGLVMTLSGYGNKTCKITQKYENRFRESISNLYSLLTSQNPFFDYIQPTGELQFGAVVTNRPDLVYPVIEEVPYNNPDFFGHVGRFEMFKSRACLGSAWSLFLPEVEENGVVVHPYVESFVKRTELPLSSVTLTIGANSFDPRLYSDSQELAKYMTNVKARSIFFASKEKERNKGWIDRLRDLNKVYSDGDAELERVSPLIELNQLDNRLLTPEELDMANKLRCRGVSLSAEILARNEGKKDKAINEMEDYYKKHHLKN